MPKVHEATNAGSHGSSIDDFVDHQDETSCLVEFDAATEQAKLGKYAAMAAWSFRWGRKIHTALGRS